MALSADAALILLRTPQTPCLSESIDPSSKKQRKLLSARLTSFSLNTDSGTDADHRATAEAADQITMQQILPRATKNKGFVDLQRFVDLRSGEFKILSLWQTKEDCMAAYENDDHYAYGLRILRNTARHGMFKTEHFDVWQLYPCDSSSLITSPYARTSTMELKEDAHSKESADGVLVDIVADAKSKPGFLGFQRLVGTGDASGTYKVVTYWDSWSSLKASGRGTKYYDSYLPALQACLKLGTDVITSEFEHLHFTQTIAAIPHVEPSGALSATFQLASISFGVGVFAMPSVFKSLGLAAGTGVLISFALLSDMSMQLMLMTAKATGASTYEDVLNVAFGPVGRTLSLVGLAISTFTANCAHMQFVSSMFVEMQGSDGGIMKTLVGDNVQLQHFTTIVIFGGLALPLCFKRTLGELQFVSLGVVLFCFCACAVVMSKCGVLISENGVQNADDVLPATMTVGVLLDQVPVAAFGFSSIAELFHVRAELKNPDILSRCAHIATMLVVGLYLIVGLVGALAFEDPGSNLLQNFPDSHLVAIIRLLIIVMVTMLYPIINFPYAQALEALIAGRFGATSSQRWKMHAVIGFIVLLLVDTLVTRLDAVFGLSGSLGLGLIAYVLPSSAALAVGLGWSRRSTQQLETTNVKSPSALAAAFIILIVGLIMTFGSTAWIIRGIVVKP